MAEGRILATIARDVTDERRQAEENIERIRKLDHAQKLEAVGTLSGGIAHDFNNTLAGIMGAASLLRQSIENGSVGEPGDMSRELEIIERSAQRAASSVRRLLMLTRKRSPESVVFRLDDAIRRVCKFTERSVAPSVSIEIPETLPEASICGDSGQVEQLILNLVINAEHAMTTMRQEGSKRGGTISIGLRQLRLERSFLDSNPDIEDRDYWALTVSDEGVGIPKHIQSRIFDPFYTTKPVDNSSGLGLAMVHAIARQHGGFVDLRSELGAGAEFTVYLPCVVEAIVTEAGPAPVHHGEGLVIIADDDEIPRETAVIILEALGYHVVAATGGEEAVRLFDERAGEWNVAVLDLRMGDLPGDEVAARMRERHPNLPIVLVSGLHDIKSYASKAFDPAFSLLPKPYTITELGQAIDAAMGRR
jgi:signal transduction histidine kinase/CheY-like chemotaxis protein